MAKRRGSVLVDGKRVRRGTSIYHTTHNRVLWIDEIYEGVVVLGTVDRTVRVSLEAFRTNVENGTLKIESQLRRGESSPFEE